MRATPCPPAARLCAGGRPHVHIRGRPPTPARLQRPAAVRRCATADPHRRSLVVRADGFTPMSQDGANAGGAEYPGAEHVIPTFLNNTPVPTQNPTRRSHTASLPCTEDVPCSTSVRRAVTSTTTRRAPWRARARPACSGRTSSASSPSSTWVRPCRVVHTSTPAPNYTHVASLVLRQNVKCEFPELNMGTPLPCGPHLHPCP
jgi:hypothetical protein